ncbi:MAG: hypothetical protein ACT4PY_05860 [Armatimonadota bacterium]
MNCARTRICAVLAILGGALWALSWSLNVLTEDGTRAVLGLSERGWRRLLDPALAFLIIALFAYRTRYSWPGSRAAAFGWSIAILGLLTMLAGNIIEFWIGELLYLDVPGQFKPTDHLGWALFLAGLMILVPAGFVVLGVAHFRSRIISGWRRLLPLLMGLLPAVLLVVATVAQAALGAVLLVFALGWVMLGYDLWSSGKRAA